MSITTALQTHSASIGSQVSWRLSDLGKRPASTLAASERVFFLRANGSAKHFKRPQDQVWFPGETVNFGIGQGYMLVTPLQLAHITATIAARGKGFKPRLVTAMRDPRTGQMRAIPPLPTEPVKVAPEHWRIVVEGMMQTMTRGTARASGQGALYTIAGKTGTAQVFSVAANTRYDEKTVGERLRDHGWFIAFAPADAPKIAIAVIVENGGFGSGTAAPIARKVMDKYLLPPSPDPLPQQGEGKDAPLG
jgi:penicillin-binding protein 2